eukprot:812881-Alexandrium_andersonii.AAC.1
MSTSATKTGRRRDPRSPLAGAGNNENAHPYKGLTVQRGFAIEGHPSVEGHWSPEALRFLGGDCRAGVCAGGLVLGLAVAAGVVWRPCPANIARVRPLWTSLSRQ